MDEEGLIQINLQIPATALDGLSRLAEQLRKLTAAVNGLGRPVGVSEEIAESGTFDPERFQALWQEEASRVRAGISKQVPAPESAGQEISETANEMESEAPSSADGNDISETGTQIRADGTETGREEILTARSEAEEQVPDPQAVQTGLESQLPEADTGWIQAEERDLPLPTVQADASAGVESPLGAGLVVTAQPEPPASRWAGLTEELAEAGPAPLTAEAVSLAFQRDGRRYDNGFPLY